MEHITILIEGTNARLTCEFNPGDQDDSFTIQRSSGATREQSGSLTGTDLSDDRIVSRGRGDTRLALKLMFDVLLVRPPNPGGDVRDLTKPLWELTEYQAVELRRVRLFWGKGWEIPAVVESIAERYERFSSSGLPQRSWLTLSMLRVHEQVPPAEPPALFPATQMPAPERLAAASESSWGIHEKLGEGAQGEHLWQLASRYYGDPRLWRLIALANDIADPLKIPAGKLLKVPPLNVLRRR